MSKYVIINLRSPTYASHDRILADQAAFVAGHAVVITRHLDRSGQLAGATGGGDQGGHTGPEPHPPGTA